MKEITKEEVQYLKRTLLNYYYLKSEEQKNLKLSFELQIILDQEIKGSGMSYEDNSNGCSTKYPRNSYVNRLIHEIRNYDLIAERCRKNYLLLDKLNHLEIKCKKLSAEQQSLIYAILRKCESISVVADRESVSRQAITERLDGAIERMLRMEV